MGFIEIECTISNNTIEVEFKNLARPTGIFSWSMDKMPKYSKNIIIQDSDNFLVAKTSDGCPNGTVRHGMFEKECVRCK